VTGKPAVQIRFLFSMAFNAESHPEMDALDSVHGFDHAVTVMAEHILL
jgi:hypothetical protein